MKARFKKNLESKGLWVRALGAMVLMVLAAWGWGSHWWIALGLAPASGFVLFEALRGWCVLRACGVRTGF
jgi:hypothetical protein